ncbi:MAG: SH3 domain-containing protein [Anaerolineae bacterium]
MTRRLPVWSLLVLALLLFGGVILVVAQEVTCRPAVDALWTLASEACVAQPDGYVCNGGSAPQIEPVGAGYALANVGGLVDVASIDMIHSSPMALDAGIAGVVWARVPQPVHFTALLLGDVLVQDVTPEGFDTWQSLIVQTAPEAPSCVDVPRSVFLAQVVQDSVATRVVINGVSIDLLGTMAVYTTPDATVFASIYGGLRVLAAGTTNVFWAGEQISVPYAGGSYSTPSGIPGAATQLDSAALANVPLALLDHPVMMPQPGFVSTQGQVNLRAAPSTNAALIAEVPPGVILSVLGSNPAGDWYHVQTTFGLSGWMFAELLSQNVGTITAVYENTPGAPVRLGTPTLLATVIAPDGVNLRDAPDVTFNAIGLLPFGATVNLEARSPYSPWVRVNYGGTVGWLALITLETTAYIDALPIDYNVPPPPEPTRIPGTWGNAFPDPDRTGG